jgi:hypothetical protein
VASDSNLTVTAGSKTVTYKGGQYTLDTECLYHNNTVYVPVVSFAKNVLGHFVKADANGLVITSATSFNLITEEETADYLIQVATRSGYKGKITPVKALNWFMSFERPDALTIEDDFWNTTSGGSEGHPRVIGTKSDFDRIRANWQTDPDLNKMVTDIINKADRNLTAICPEYAIPDKQRILSQARNCLEYFRNLGFDRIVSISAKQGAGMNVIADAVKSFYPDAEKAVEGEILANARQHAALSKAVADIDKSLFALDVLTPDTACLDMEAALGELLEADGRQVSEEIVNNIFAHFCVGK